MVSKFSRVKMLLVQRTNTKGFNNEASWSLFKPIPELLSGERYKISEWANRGLRNLRVAKGELVETSPFCVQSTIDVRFPSRLCL